MKILIIPGPFQRTHRQEALELFSNRLGEGCEHTNVEFSLYRGNSEEISTGTRPMKADGISAIVDKLNDERDIGYFVFLSHLVKHLKQHDLLFLFINYEFHPPKSNEFEVVPYERDPLTDAVPLFDDAARHLYNFTSIANRVKKFPLNRKSPEFLHGAESEDSTNSFRILREYVLPFFDYKEGIDPRLAKVPNWELVPYSAGPLSGEQPAALCSDYLSRFNHIHYAVSKNTEVNWPTKPTCIVDLPDGDHACFWIHNADLPSYRRIVRTANSLPDLRR